MNANDRHNHKRTDSRHSGNGNGNTLSDNHPNILQPERPLPDNIGNVAEVDVSIQIEQLVDEKERGIISADEFARKKAALLKRR